MQATDPITVIIKLQKYIKMSIEDNAQALISGGVDTMEKYNYITGKIHGLDQIQQEISILLEPTKEPDDDKVTRIRR